MKAKSVLFALSLLVAAHAAQDSITLHHQYKEGDRDTYHVDLTLTTAMGDLDVDGTTYQEVKKVYDNGDADIFYNADGLKGSFNGQEVPVPAQQFTIKVNQNGLPLDTKGLPAEAASRIQTMRASAILYGKELKVGQTLPIDFTDPKNPKIKVNGNVTLASVSDGEAKVESKLSFYEEASDTPTQSESTTYIDVASGKMNRMDTKMTDLPAMPNAPVQVLSATMSLKRIKS